MHSTEQRVMALEGALACHSALYLVGCAGIGKSWLVNEWLKGAPYSHWSVRAGGGVAAALAQFLPGESAGQARAQAVQAVAQVIRRAAPTLLVIDHLHEASADELAFWAQVRGQLQSARGVRIVALSRRHLPLSWPVHDILPKSPRRPAGAGSAE